MPRHPKTVEISNWQGLNNVLKPENTPRQYLKTAENVDIDKLGNLTLRKGYSKKLTGSFHSLWSDGFRCFCVKDGSLVEVHKDLTTTELDTGYSTEKVSFEKVDGIYYFISSLKRGKIQGTTVYDYGIEINTNFPILSSTVGSLVKGEYSVGYTYVNSSGVEGGMLGSSDISFATNSGGIVVSNFIAPTDPNITTYRIYCTAGDSVLYWYGDYPIGTTSVTINSLTGLVTELQTFGIFQPPLGQIIRYFSGRMYIAEGDTLWFSNPFSYDKFSLESNYKRFPNRITNLMPVEDGIWVISDKIYYLSGHDPTALNYKAELKEHTRGIEGTEQKLSGSYIHIDNMPVGFKWAVTTEIGIFILFNQGILLNMTAQNIDIGLADSGSSIFLQQDGINRYISLLKAHRANNFRVGDVVTATHIRNGIVIDN